MDRSAIILAYGSSSRFNIDKGLLELDGKLLISHMVDAVKDLVKEVIVVTSSQEFTGKYTKLVSSKVKFVVDVCESKGPLVGALKGFEAANGEYLALLPFGNPFVSKDVLSLLFDCCVGKSAVIPRYTNMEIEPLHAVYNTKNAFEAAKEALEENEEDMHAMVDKLRGVRYISTTVIEQLDPDLKTFFNINTPLDLKKAEVMIKPRKTSKKKSYSFKKR